MRRRDGLGGLVRGRFSLPTILGPSFSLSLGACRVRSGVVVPAAAAALGFCRWFRCVVGSVCVASLVRRPCMCCIAQSSMVFFGEAESLTHTYSSCGGRGGS